MCDQNNVVIAALNDEFRRTMQNGRVVLTRGVLALDPVVAAQTLAEIRLFDDFTPDNDPYGEHDFGSVRNCFFKIDYYADSSMTLGAENGLHCYRVLTIMLKEEY